MLNLGIVTPTMIGARSLARTASYSASLLDTGKPRVKDCLMIYPSGVVRIILMTALLLFEALSMFRIHLASRSVCSVAPRVKSAIK